MESANIVQNIIGIPGQNEDEFEQITQQLACFSSDAAWTYSEELIEYLALHALAKLPPGLRSTQDIHEQLRQLINLPIERDQLLLALRRLANKHESGVTGINTESDFHAQFKLETQMTSELIQKYKAFVAMEQEVVDSWVEDISNKYPALSEDNLNVLRSDLKHFSWLFFSHHTLENILLYFEHNDIDRILKKIDRIDFAELFPHKQDDLDIIRAIEIPKFFKRPDLKTQQYLAKQLNGFLALQMYKLKPDAAATVNREIVGGTIYLDTNFIFRLLGQNGEQSIRESAVRLVKISQSLGYNVVVSSRTIEEYKHVVRRFVEEEAPRFRHISRQVAANALEASLDEGLYQHYLRIVRDSRSFTAKEYWQQYKNIEILLSQYNVSVDDKYEQYFNSNQDEVVAEASRLRIAVQEWKGSDYAAEHDAYMRLLILSARQGSESTSPYETRYWFLTCDSKLPKYDRVRRASEGQKVPFLVLSSHWMQLLSRFASDEESYLRVVAAVQESPLFRIFSPPRTDTVRQILSRLTLNDGTVPDIAAKLLVNDMFLYKFGNIKNKEEKDRVFEDTALATLSKEVETKNIELNKELEEKDLLLSEQEELLHAAWKVKEEAHVENDQIKKKLEDVTAVIETKNNTIKELEEEIEKFKQAQEVSQVSNTKTDAPLVDDIVSVPSQPLDESKTAEPEAKLAADATPSVHQNWATLVIIIVTISTLLIVRPWSLDGNLKYLTASILLMACLLIQFVWMNYLWRWQRVYQFAVSSINIFALVVAVVHPIGLGIPGAISIAAGISTIVAAVFSVIRKPDHN